MPKDNIQRAITKATGGDAENYDEIRYEGRGPGGVALIVETMTDNRNRTSADVRAAFSKYGGAMGETGSVSFMFDHVGAITYPAAKGSEDAMLEAALETGADECVSTGDGHEFRPRSRISPPCATRWKPGWVRRNRPVSSGGRRAWWRCRTRRARH